MPAPVGIKGFFGEKVKTYADYAASGQAVPHIEAYLLQHVVPYYANTHTESSDCGRYMNSLYQQARHAIAAELAADRDKYAVIFTGSGATGALHKLASTMLKGCQEREPGQQLPVVLLGPHEHHSNEVMWRELHCKLVVIPEGSSGRLDLVVLEQQLLQYRDSPMRIGSFSAGSNVTGITEDVEAVAEVMHRHGGVACFDYAGAGSHVPISMAAPEGRPLAYKDAIVMSPHKMLGGPGTCGLLVAARKLFHHVPTIPGGGTVAFVTATDHHYSSDEEHREEAGTPNILGAIRCGAAFVLRAALSAHLIHSLESAAATALIASLRTNPNIVLLGAEAPAYSDAHRMAIVSLLVKVPWAAGLPGRGVGKMAGHRLLHHNFVCKILNDVYGIQGRSGCSCAGPYGMQLLGITEGEAARLKGLVMGHEMEAFKPGWMRLSLSFQQHPLEVQYIAAALHQVAEHGWRLLPQYTLDAMTGAWTHRSDAATTLQSYYPTCDLHQSITAPPSPMQSPRLWGRPSPSTPRRPQTPQTPQTHLHPKEPAPYHSPTKATPPRAFSAFAALMAPPSPVPPGTPMSLEAVIQAGILRPSAWEATLSPQMSRPATPQTPPCYTPACLPTRPLCNPPAAGDPERSSGSSSPTITHRPSDAGSNATPSASPPAAANNPHGSAAECDLLATIQPCGSPPASAPAATPLAAPAATNDPDASAADSPVGTLQPCDSPTAASFAGSPTAAPAADHPDASATDSPAPTLQPCDSPSAASLTDNPLAAATNDFDASTAAESAVRTPQPCDSTPPASPRADPQAASDPEASSTADVPLPDPTPISLADPTPTPSEALPAAARPSGANHSSELPPGSPHPTHSVTPDHGAPTAPIPTAPQADPPTLQPTTTTANAAATNATAAATATAGTAGCGFDTPAAVTRAQAPAQATAPAPAEAAAACAPSRHHQPGSPKRGFLAPLLARLRPSPRSFPLLRKLSQRVTTSLRSPRPPSNPGAVASCGCAGFAEAKLPHIRTHGSITTTADEARATTANGGQPLHAPDSISAAVAAGAALACVASGGRPLHTPDSITAAAAATADEACACVGSGGRPLLGPDSITPTAEATADAARACVGSGGRPLHASDSITTAVTAGPVLACVGPAKWPALAHESELAAEGVPRTISIRAMWLRASPTSCVGSPGPTGSTEQQPPQDKPRLARADGQRPTSRLLDVRGAQDPAAAEAMRKLQAEYAAAEETLKECLWRPAQRAGEVYGRGLRQPNAKAMGRVYKRQLQAALELYTAAAAWGKGHRDDLEALEAEARMFTGALEQCKWWVQPAEAASEMALKVPLASPRDAGAASPTHWPRLASITSAVHRSRPTLP